MGIELHINTILRSDEPYKLKVGGEYDFLKEGKHIFADNMPIWLTKKDWTALAEIEVLSQSRDQKKTTAKFKVRYIYKPGGEEQKALTEIFRRMYEPLFG